MDKKNKNQKRTIPYDNPRNKYVYVRATGVSPEYQKQIETSPE